MVHHTFYIFSKNQGGILLFMQLEDKIMVPLQENIKKKKFYSNL